MKRVFSIIAISLIPFIGINAQEEKECKSRLPEKGDFSIGLNVIPIFKYVGNIFNGTADNSINYLGGEPITKDDNSGIGLTYRLCASTPTMVTGF